jgi:hypothetical protein
MWDQQCVRLRVNVKSDNCGENAECSGKGICFSNASMVSNQKLFIFLFALRKLLLISLREEDEKVFLVEKMFLQGTSLW